LCLSPDITYTATYTLNAAPAVTSNEPTDETVESCDFADQAAVDADFAAWVTAQTAAIAVGGGCDPQIDNDAPTAGPTHCDGGDITVTWTITDLCLSPDITYTATYTLNAAPPVVMDCPADREWLACQTQAAVDADFQDWLDDFGFSGGCNGFGTFDENYAAPDACGGSVTVTYIVTSDCEVDQECTRTYTIPTPPALSIACPSTVVEASCQDQAAIDAAFTVWLGTVSAVGGCDNNTVTNNNTGAPDACGGSVTVTFTATDNTCGLTSSCMATFTVTAAPDITITGVADFTTTECQTQAQVDQAFNDWLDDFGFSGGCPDATDSNSAENGNCPSFVVVQNNNKHCFS
jgi:hypothetical protein